MTNFTKLGSWIAQDLQLLARLHAFELDTGTLDLLRRSDFPDSLSIDVDTDHLEHPIRPVMRKAFEEIQRGEVRIDDLAADFAAIYLNGTFSLSPNESTWIDEDHLERQEAMFDIRDWYKKHGLITENWRVRSEDNLALQILFISRLLQKSEIPLDDLGLFMDFHVLRWVEDFAQAVFRRADTSFYASLAIITSRHLEIVRQLVSEWQGKPRLTRDEVRKMTGQHQDPSTAQAQGQQPGYAQDGQPGNTEALAQFDSRFYTSFDGGW